MVLTSVLLGIVIHVSVKIMKRTKHACHTEFVNLSHTANCVRICHVFRHDSSAASVTVGAGVIPSPFTGTGIKASFSPNALRGDSAASGGVQRFTYSCSMYMQRYPTLSRCSLLFIDLCYHLLQFLSDASDLSVLLFASRV